MSSTQNSTLARNFVEEIFNARNTEAAKNFVTPDIVYHGMGEEVSGIEEFKRWVSEDLSAFPVVQGPERRVALAVSGDDIYIAWITNKTGNDDVVFRSSNDAGATFNDKLILSNTTNATLQDIQIAVSDENVAVLWWQTNATSEEPVARISADNGLTFESVANLTSNGTINVIT